MVDAVLEFPDYENAVLPVRLVVDTGAARTAVGPLEVSALEEMVGKPAKEMGAYDISVGVGGAADSRIVRCVLTMMTEGGKPWSRRIDIVLLLRDEESNLAPPPSLLGRNILYELPLYVDFQKHIVLLHDQTDA